MQQLENFLKQLPLFESFSRQELRGLLDKSEVKTFAPEEVIITFGQPGSFLGIVLDGEAEAALTGERGERRRLGVLKPGDFLGEMSLLTGEPTSADVIATRECRLLLIPQDTFCTYLAANANAVRVMARTITERLKGRGEDEEVQARVENAWRSAPDPYGIDLSSAKPMKILVINCGSSSLKFSYFDTAREDNNIEGKVERIGQDDSRLVSLSRNGSIERELGSVDYEGAFQAVVDLLTNPENGVIGDLSELSAVGHRVVHGGEKYSRAVLIDDEVLDDIERNSTLAPLHNPPNLMAIRASGRLIPGVPQVAVFDTGFHQRMPPHAYLYGLPYEFYREDHIRRYGFHGISHNYVALKAAAHLKRSFRELKLITCHLGNGASLCAIDHGRSVDTSMGLTPLEGLVMGTRCGDLDPAVVMHFWREKGMSVEEVDEILNRRSGLQGLSGISGDLRELEEAGNRGDPRAILTIHVFCYRIRKYIGAYIAAIGGLDALVFTGGIGEGSAWIRGLACQGLAYMGIEVDDMLNRTSFPRPGEVAEISSEDSPVRVLLIPTDEGRMIARETIRTLGYQDVAQVIERQREKQIPVEVSVHHVHLARPEVDVLFGPGYRLTHRSDLSQPGLFECDETLNLVGPKGRVDRVRIVGPERRESQVEISMSEESKLGIKAPVRSSGDLEGTPGISLEGPKGSCVLSKGVICPIRHIHMNAEDALSFGLKDRDLAMVKVKGDRTLIYGDVLVRVDPNYRLSMHIDMDEANAANIETGMSGYLSGVQDRR